MLEVLLLTKNTDLQSSQKKTLRYAALQKKTVDRQIRTKKAVPKDGRVINQIICV